MDESGHPKPAGKVSLHERNGPNGTPHRQMIPDEAMQKGLGTQVCKSPISNITT